MNDVVRPDSNNRATELAPRFEAPGPGEWVLDRSHYTGGTTPIIAELMTSASEAALELLFADIGVPAKTLRARFVHGFLYTRLVPLIGENRSATKAPPAAVIKLVSRLHPEFRRRNKRAEAALDNPNTWSSVFADWRARIKPSLMERNVELGRVELAGLSDAELAAHCGTVIDHARQTFQEHFRLHGYDLGPLGRLVVRGQGWGIESADLFSGLVGASPSTTEPRVELNEIRAAVESAGGSLTDLNSMRSASTQVAAMLDAYIERHGSLLYTGYDIDGPTLGERPAVLARSIRSAQPVVDVGAGATAAATAIRARIPSDDQPVFDRLLGEARDAMDMRDDNGPITVEWPAGLVRLGLVEAGRRLAASGRVSEPDHVFELSADEISDLLDNGNGPSPDELDARAVRRAYLATLTPPQTLGPPEAEPPIHALPAAMAALINMTNAVLQELGMGSVAEIRTDSDGALLGIGIGTSVFEATARTAETAEEAFDALEPGEILITRATSPAYNLVLSLSGGLVTETGGPMCHAAVLARELAIPAVIGPTGVLDMVTSGDRVRIDPHAGSVTVISSQ